MNLSDLLTHLMRPAGGGIPVISAGKGAAFELQKNLYTIMSGGKPGIDEAAIQKIWKQSWFELAKAKTIIIGVPLDTGAGIRRGAAYGPRAVRGELLKIERYRELIRSRSVIDLGDIYVNPHLLHDEMLSQEQKQLCQDQMYPTAPPSLRAQFSVSALSQLKQVLQLIVKEYAHLKVFVIGGDHSVAWPVTEVLAERYPRALGIVQPDAHTDLLPARLGIKYCFGTWSYHANELIGRGGKMVQLGIRQSGRDKTHWESTTEVKQYWADEVLKRSHHEVIAEIVSHLKERGIKQIYFSNDIDGTDESEASATGTPATEGLSSEFVLKTIKALGENFSLVGADVMEVAPDLGQSVEATEATCSLAARYALACLEQQIKSS